MQQEFGFSADDAAKGVQRYIIIAGIVKPLIGKGRRQIQPPGIGDFVTGGCIKISGCGKVLQRQIFADPFAVLLTQWENSVLPLKGTMPAVNSDNFTVVSP